jgi:hypothetical protein
MSPITDPLSLYRAIHEITRPLPARHWPFVARAVPSSGVYLVYEGGELFEGQPRIVRVGSHQRPGRLPGRLRDHWSNDKNGSVFRKHLGSALMQQRGYPDSDIALWMHQGTHGWPEIEQAIGDELRSRFTFSCIRVDEPFEWVDIERQLIASLTRLGISPTSPGWLGRFASNAVVRACGMWVDKHVGAACVLDDAGLQRLATLVDGSAS